MILPSVREIWLNECTINNANALCVRLNISVSELARKCGKSPEAFSQKMKRDGFSTTELKEIVTAVECQYIPSFILPNGKSITDNE